MTTIDNLRIKIFADGADRDGMLRLYTKPWISGFTTNPTLMHMAGITDYEKFARSILQDIPDKPLSFEVFSDDFDEMRRQALKIAAWGKNVYVKIPITNTRGESACPLIRKLADSGVKLNITALMTLEQVKAVSEAAASGPSTFVSIFAGRIADTGLDPVPLIARAVEIVAPHPQQEILWASPREVLNIFQADRINCHIITVTHSILAKLTTVGKNLDELSLDTVKMFRNDAVAAGFSL